MRIDELCSRLGKSRSTIEKRIKKLTAEQIEVIRVSVSNGKLHHYEYNETALALLQTEQTEQTESPILAKEIIKFKDELIIELKAEITYLKGQIQQIQQHQQNIEIAYSESSKYMQTLLSRQQQITMDLQQKLQIEAPKKKGWNK